MNNTWHQGTNSLGYIIGNKVFLYMYLPVLFQCSYQLAIHHFFLFLFLINFIAKFNRYSY